MEEIESVASEIADSQRSARWRYQGRLREKIAACAKRALAKGMTQSQIAKRLGITPQTLSRIVEESQPFKPIRLERRSYADFTVVGPEGLKIEGLSVEELAELIQFLA